MTELEVIFVCDECMELLNTGQMEPDVSVVAEWLRGKLMPDEVCIDNAKVLINAYLNDEEE